MAFLGIKVPHETARLLGQIEIEGVKESPATFHITLLYLGKDVPVEDLAKCVEATFDVTSVTQPFTARTNVVSSFPANPDDGIPIICRVESEPLHALQAAIKASFTKHGVPFNDKYPEYKPHITLGYLAEGAPQDHDIPTVEWGVAEVVLWGGDVGDDRLVVQFPFSLASGREAAYRAIVRLAALKMSSEVTVDDHGYAHDDEGNQWFVGKQYAGHIYPATRLPPALRPPDEAPHVAPGAIEKLKKLEEAARAAGNAWMRDFAKSIGHQVARGRALSPKQQQIVERGFKQFKIASSEWVEHRQRLPDRDPRGEGWSETTYVKHEGPYTITVVDRWAPRRSGTGWKIEEGGTLVERSRRLLQAGEPEHAQREALEALARIQQAKTAHQRTVARFLGVK